METQLNVGEVSTLNFEAIQELAKSSAAASFVFGDLAARRKHLYRSININSYADKLDLDTNTVLEIFKGFEAQGLGSVVIGRDNTCPTQFIPQYNLKAIGAA